MLWVERNEERIFVHWTMRSVVELWESPLYEEMSHSQRETSCWEGKSWVMGAEIVVEISGGELKALLSMFKWHYTFDVWCFFNSRLKISWSWKVKTHKSSKQMESAWNMFLGANPAYCTSLQSISNHEANIFGLLIWTRISVNFFLSFKAGSNCDSCDELCLKPRPDGCIHDCKLPCHPG